MTINQAPTNGVVAVGSRQIQGVADGALTATSTDAVNGAQLFQTATSLNANTNALGTATTTALGGGAAYNTTTGAFTAPLYSLAAGTFNNVGSALTALDTQGSKYFKANSTLAGANASGTNAIAAGPAAQATGTNSAAFGNGASVSVTDGLAVGRGSSVTLANSVALGAGSTATVVSVTTANTTANAVVSGKTLTINQAPTNGVVAVGSRQIQGVADGALTSTSTDAVNGAQLFQTATNLNANTSALGTASSTALGGGATYNMTTGAFSAPLYSLAAGTFNDVGSALTALDTLGSKYFKANSVLAAASASGANAIAAGPAAQASGINSAAFGNGANVSVIDGLALGRGSSVTLANSVALGAGSAAAAVSATTANTAANTVVSGKTLTINQAPTNGVVGIGNRQIQGVADGALTATSTDAVNGSQLFQTATNLNANANALGTAMTTALGGGAAYNATTGAFTAPLYSLAAGTFNNVGAALTAMDGQGTKYFKSNSFGSGSTAAGTDSIAIGPDASATQTNTIAMGNAAKATGTDAIAIGAGALATGSIAAGVSTKAGGGGAAFGDYADAGGTAQSTSTTVTKGTALGHYAVVETNDGVALGSRSVAATAAGVMGYDPATNASSTVTSSTWNSTLGAVSVGGSGDTRQITNLAAGTADTDAVNLAQLKALDTEFENVADRAVLYDGALGSPKDTLTLAGANSTDGGVTNGTRVTNLSAGMLSATSTDAVNGAQLYSGLSSVGGSTASLLGAGAAYNPVTGTISAPSYTVQGNTYNDVGSAFGAVDSDLSSLSTSVATGALGVVQRTATADEMALVAAGGTGAAPGASQKLTNLSAGALSATSTDAVNGSQLLSTNTNLSNLGSSAASNLGGGAAFDSVTGTISAPSYTVQGNTYNDVGSAFGAVDSDLSSLSTSVATGALGVVQRTATADEMALVAAGGTGAAPGASQKLTNLSAGTLSATSTDAVNGSQLFSTNTNLSSLGSSAASNLGGGAAFDSVTGTISAPSYTVQGNTYNDVGSAFGAVDSDLSSLSTSVATGALGVVQRTATADEMALVAAGGTGAAPGASQKLTNLSAGTLSATSTDAVNGSQLFSTNTNLSNLGSSAASNLGGGAAFDSVTGTISAPSYTVQGNTYNNVGSTFGAVDSALTSLDIQGSKYFKTNSLATGSVASGVNAIAIGPDASATQANAIAMGNAAQATGIDAIAIGAGALATGSIATGVNAKAGGGGAAFGDYADAGGTALSANATVTKGTAVGHSSVVETNDGVALGSHSVATTAAGAMGYDPATDASSASTSSTWRSTLGAVSVGGNGDTRQVTNLAAGTSDTDAVNLAQLKALDSELGGAVDRAVQYDGAVGSAKDTLTLAGANSTDGGATNGTKITNLSAGALSATSTDAVNGAQLFSTNTNLSNLGGSTASSLGGGATYDPITGTISAPSYTVQGNTYNNVGSAIGAVDSDLSSLNSSLTTGAVGVVQRTAMADEMALVAFGARGVAPGATQRLTNLSAGRLSATSTDAVNGAQLYATDQQVALNTSSIANLDNRITVIGGTVDGLISGSGIKYFHANSTKSDSVASGGNSVAVGPNAQATGEGAVASGNDAVASNDGSIAIGSGATSSGSGSVALGAGSSDNGQGADSYTGKYSNATNVIAGTVSVGNATTGQVRTVSNVADGRDATDAVNVRQLDGAVAQSKQYTDASFNSIKTTVEGLGTSSTKLESQVTQIQTTVSAVQSGTDGMFQVDGSSKVKPTASGSNAVAGGASAVASGANSTALGNASKATEQNAVAVGNGASATAKNSAALGANSVADRENSVSVGASGSERQITNVAAATKGTDAVNFDQLNKSVAELTGSANSYTDQRYAELKHDLKEQDETLSAGIAGAMAMASLPQPHLAGASMTSFAAANYRGQSALSLGVSRISDNGRWVSKLQATTNSQGDAGIGVGVGYQW
ncbi:YadA-like family protein [Pseudomonas shahriarae]|uniref:YadA family autotransporter adhesin n=1 Tax=Pseudomonas shahriarae TaxID=2745512 RepID=UPI002360CEDC|nr:YadA family autotransporter adhesin [Pseudomonas shahriarae]MDD1033201.1 YadA-like family protein [Pseudomonas shahriarae]